jgi:hypothetical protein
MDPASNTAAARTIWERNLLLIANLLKIFAGRERDRALAAWLKLTVLALGPRFRPFILPWEW